MQHARPVGPTGVNAPATFGPEMVAGSLPAERSRFYTPVHRQGLTLSQTTHVAAPFIPAMAQGVTAPQPRYTAPFHQGVSVLVPEVPVFSVEMVVGSRPESPRLLLGAKIPLPVSQTTHTAAAFSPEMAQGAHPDRSREFSKPQLGWSVSQTTHTEALFAPAMTQGVTAPQSRYIAPRHTGWFWLTTEVENFSPDMVQGSRPDRARILLGARIGLPVSQTTHTSAPFSLEMAQGARPTERGRFFPGHQGWSVSLLDSFASVATTFTGKVFLVSSHRRGFSVPGHDRLFSVPTTRRTP